MTESLYIFSCGRWQRTSGFGGITSSIYLNLIISIKQNDDNYNFVKKLFSLSLPVLLTWRHLDFDCGYLSYFTFEWVTIWSERWGLSMWLCGHIKYHVTLKVIMTFGVSCKVNNFFLYRFIRHYITNYITSNFQQLSLRKGKLRRCYVINFFKLEYLRYLLSDWPQTSLSKIRLMIIIYI